MRATLALFMLVSTTAIAEPAPATDKQPVVDVYHGVKVTDDYRWLESADDPAVKKWVEAQSAWSRAILDKLPHADDIRERVSQIQRHPHPGYSQVEYAGGRLIAQKSQPPKERPLLVWMPSADEPDKEKVILDLNVLDPEGNTSIDFYYPSRDGKRVAVSLSKKGTESGDVSVYDVDTAKEVGPPVPRVNSGTAGGTLAWNGDGSGFYYTRHPLPGERPPEDMGFYQQVYFHKVGDDPKNDTYQLGKDFPRIAESFLDTSRDGKYAVDLVQKGDGGEFELFVGDAAAGKWTKVAEYADKVKGAKFGADGSLYVLSTKGAPRGQILRVSPQAPSLAKAEVVVPQGEEAIEDYLATPGRLYVEATAGGPSRLDIYPLQGENRKPMTVATLPVSAVTLGSQLEADDVLFYNVSYVDPGAWYRVDGKTGKVAKTALAKQSPIDTSRFEVVRETAVSKDGTVVPMSIIRPKGLKRNGKGPALLYAYGGYGITQSPNFNSQFLMLAEQGVVVAIANIRGGREFGEEWHLGGNLTKKQNVFDDFYASARKLVARRYTGPKRLAIVGGSNGGLLMGAALTQHPEAYGVVVAFVGVHDMLRVENDPNGAFNVTEYGTVKDKAQFEALHAYSPYHRVRDGVRYPPTMLTTGLNDPRVRSYHSFKMAARLQAADPKGQFLLRVNPNTGHGAGKLSDTIELQTDALAFLLHHLGVTYRPVAR